MSTSDKHLLEFIARVVYNIEDLPGRLKVFFNRFMTFHFSEQLSVNQIQDIENRNASKGFFSEAELAQSAAQLSAEQRVWAAAVMLVLQTEAGRMDDRKVLRNIGHAMGRVLDVLAIGSQSAELQAARKSIEAELHQFNNRPVVQVRTALWPLGVDYALRWAWVFVFSYLGYDKQFLVIFNTFLFPLLTFGIVYLAGRSYRRANRKLLEEFGGEHRFLVRYKVSTVQYTWLAFFFGSGVYVSYLLPDQSHVFAVVGLLVYYMVYLRYLRIGKLSENELVKQLEKDNLRTENLSVDENDEVIVSLETKLNSAASRLEAYVLESALFGALSFSGFLQIIATELISFKDLEAFAAYIYSASQSFIDLNGAGVEAGLAGLSTKQSLFCLVSVESLICSIFFLAVIASRLRFSNITDRVRTAINMARAYNEKEESLHEEQEISGRKISRLEELTRKVNAQLQEANVILKEIAPVMTYMEYFRNAGILTFVVILISSSLFITGTLGWMFIALVVATFVYFNRARLNDISKSLVLNFRLRFIQWGTYLLLLSIFPYFLAYILKIGFHMRVELLFPVSAFLTSSYISLWLVIASHVDERFGEIEMDKQILKRWNVIRNLVAINILLFGVAWLMKLLQLMGANEALMVSLLSLSALMYFVGYMLAKVKWVGVVAGGALAIGGVGALFKFLHLNGANEMALIATVSLTVLCVLMLIFRNLFHKLFVRFCFGTLVVGLWFGPFTFSVRHWLTLAYENETLNYAEIRHVHEVTSANEVVYDLALIQPLDTVAIALAISQAEGYMQEYGTRFGFNAIYDGMVRMRYGFGSDVLQSDLKSDRVRLEWALKLAQQNMRIWRMFDFRTEWVGITEALQIESDLLLALGRKEEARRSLQLLLANSLPKETDVALRKRLKSLL